MTFTNEERRLINLFHSCSVKDTVSVVLDALPDISEPDVRTAAVSVIGKLERMNDAEYNCLFPESEDCYV